ncbi:MAG: hypothetical protein D6722_04850 [Bacteroidetes bacterium]|nr:MAG: hypothetical protein D6722_04850 [Bacteroidota bacterium]
MKDQSQQTSRAILVIVGILVLSALGYFATKYFMEKEAGKEKDERLEALSQEIYQLEEDIATLQVERDDQAEDILKKEEQLALKSRQLEEVINRLDEARQAGKLNVARIRELETQVSNLQQTIAQNRETIRQLQEENAQLAQALDSIRGTSAILQEENAILAAENDAKEQQLAQDRARAARLKAVEFTFYEYNTRRDKRGKAGTRFANGQDAIETCFTLLDNAFAEKGTRDIYLVIEDPTGQTLTNEAGYSGTFSVEGQTRAYSATTQVNYRGLSEEICLIWARPDGRDGKFMDGPHYVSIFCEGEVIGRGTFEIK